MNFFVQAILENLLVIFGASCAECHTDASALVPRVGHSSPGFTAQYAAVGVVHLSVGLGKSTEKGV